MPDQAEGRKDGELAGKAPDRVNSELLRDHLGKYLGLTEHARREFVITKNGKPVARLVPVEADAA